MIDLQNISFSYNHQPILNNFDLNIEKGRNTILIGPSGCGKSTILRLVNRLIKPQKGQIKINADVLDDVNIRSMRLNMGYVIQEGGLFPNMTAWQNVSLVAQRLKWPVAKINERLLELSELTQIEKDLLDRYPDNLSGGQRQRISLMRALMLDPDILLLDEPFAALDPLIRNELQESMQEIFGRLKKTVLMVTHDLHEAAFLADRIVLINDGRIVQSGTIENLIKSPASEFVKKFVSAQRSHLPGRAE